MELWSNEEEMFELMKGKGWIRPLSAISWTRRDTVINFACKHQDHLKRWLPVPLLM